MLEFEGLEPAMEGKRSIWETGKCRPVHQSSVSSSS